MEASYRMVLVNGGSFVPKLELGACHDGGDAETGFGIELGGGLTFDAPRVGVQFNLQGRTLISHKDDDFENKGIAASMVFDSDARTDRGLSMAVRHGFGGQSSGGLDALFRPEPLARQGGGFEESHLSFQWAYGLPAFGGSYTASPYGEFSFGQTVREYAVGWRWTPLRDAQNLSFGVRTSRSESDGEQALHQFGFEAMASW